MRNWFLMTFHRLSRWAEASALRYFVIPGVCCGDEFVQTVGARYDLERFGARAVEDHHLADVLVVMGAISEAAAQELKDIFQEMSEPKWVLALGTCACSGGLFSSEQGGAAVSGVSKLVPVDVFVPGCPPRPEAIIDGWMELQRKIQKTEKIAIRKRRRP